MSDRLTSSGADVAVRLTSVAKTYRLYREPLYRFLDLLGLCSADGGYYTTHHALANVNIEVGRGEKVAIIGRNGAGKSTMLKVITGLVKPTSGNVEVNGRISNLLQIGSGFHPDFTGRQNVFASLAHQGLVGRAALDLFGEIVAFSEIHEYIDQPMKTYSTGMCSRLMFSSAVVMNPDILIVDEILGVGDAYFAHKSFERMRDLCSHDGATLLLVTHDIYGAQNLCERFIWIDRGHVKYDGDSKTAVAMYETSVREQEEASGRRRAVVAVAEVAPPSTQSLNVIVRSRTGFALQRPLALDLIELVDEAGHIERLDVAASSPSWHLLAEGNLGPAATVGGRPCRVLGTFGSIFHKAEWIVTLPSTFTPVRARVQWHYEGTDEAEFAVVRDGDVVIKGELAGRDAWQTAAFDVELAAPADPLAQTEFGSGLVQITKTQLLDADGFDVVSVRHGAPLVIRVSVDASREVVGRDITFVLAFTRHDTSYAVNVVEHHLRLPNSPHAEIDVTLPVVQLGSGAWLLRVGLAEAGMFKQGALGYFAVDKRWYHLMREGIRFEVESVDQLDSAGCFMVHAGHFAVREGGDSATAPMSEAPLEASRNGR